MKRDDRIQGFVETIWSWYAVHKRILPWRDLQIADDTERAYRILVSEVMLQQTQVPRVIHAYKRFLETFPTLADLASASSRDVLLAWRGMGYNSRALRLRDAAKTIVDSFLVSCFSFESSVNALQRKTKNEQTKNIFPRSMEELQSVPGIGHYTAAAIRNFAFNLPTPCIDTNIRRILHRTFVGPENPDGIWEKSDAYLLEIAEEVLKMAISHLTPNPSPLRWRGEPRSSLISSPPLHRSGEEGQGGEVVRTPADWHAALMDFGSLVQTKISPKWDICPLTAKGIMKTTKKNFMHRSEKTPQRGVSTKREPGRIVGSTFIPNRIFRGKIVEALRDAPRGLELEKIGKEVCIDWQKSHEQWLQSLITKLIQERLLAAKGKKFFLHDS